MTRTIPIARKPPTDGSDTTPPKTRRRAAPATRTVGATPGTPRKKAAAAGPKRATRRAAPSPTPVEVLDRIQAAIVESLDADKAEHIVTLDLAGRASFTDRMVIATGLADRQITAMAQHLEKKLHEEGIKRVQIEGAGGSDWVLIDAGDIVVHLFKPDARSLYALEKMWGTAFDEPAGTE